MGIINKCLVILSCLIPLLSSILTSDQTGRKLVCYVELWAESRFRPMNYNLDALPKETCDYLVLLYLTLDPENWSLKLHNGYTEVEPDQLRKASSLKEKDPKMKVLLSVGGWEDGVKKYSDMISEKGRRTAFIASVVQTLEQYNLDGLELHWLYPGAVWRGGRAGDKDNFEQLVKELISEFRSRNWILTASVSANENEVEKGYNVKRLSSLLHQFHVRTFDLRGDWLPNADNHSPLYGKPFEGSLKNLNVNQSLAMWERMGANKRKLIPIFPLFGRSFTLKNARNSEPGSPAAGPGKSYPYTMAPGIMAYFEICDALQQGLLKRHFESATQTPYAVEDDQWVGYDDEVSLEKKVKFVEDRGLAGVALFAVSMDDFAGKCGQAHFLLKKTREFMP